MVEAPEGQADFRRAAEGLGGPPGCGRPQTFSQLVVWQKIKSSATFGFRTSSGNGNGRQWLCAFFLVPWRFCVAPTLVSAEVKEAADRSLLLTHQLLIWVSQNDEETSVINPDWRSSLSSYMMCQHNFICALQTLHQWLCLVVKEALRAKSWVSIFSNNKKGTSVLHSYIPYIMLSDG